MSEQNPCGCKIHQTIPTFIEMANGDAIHLSEKAIKRLPIPEFEYCPTHARAFEQDTLLRELVEVLEGFLQYLPGIDDLADDDELIPTLKNADVVLRRAQAAMKGTK